MKLTIVNTILIFLFLFFALGALLYFNQERLIFFPEKLEKAFQFTFNKEFEELNFKTKDNIQLNGLLFKSGGSKGLVFYLHGNAGSIRDWGWVSETYTNLQYDVFVFDYRGYGKSEGKITSQEQLYQDVQDLYDGIKNRYDERKIVIIGYSIGTGPAAKLASTNNPKLLILQAPYFSLTDVMNMHYPFVPGFLLKYRLETNRFVKDCHMPVIIFHGDEDEVISHQSSFKLKAVMKATDTLITLKGQAHNGITDNPVYQAEIKRILSQ